MYQKNFGKRLTFDVSVGAFCLAKLEQVSITCLPVVVCTRSKLRSSTRTPYLTILVRRPLFNGYIIIISRYPENPLGSTWLHSARGMGTYHNIILFIIINESEPLAINKHFNNTRSFDLNFRESICGNVKNHKCIPQEFTIVFISFSFL